MVVNQGWVRPGCQGVPVWEKAYVLISQGGKLQRHDLQIRIGIRNRNEFQGIYFSYVASCASGIRELWVLAGYELKTGQRPATRFHHTFPTSLKNLFLRTRFHSS